MLSNKKYAKIEKALGKESMAELEALSAEDLKNRLVAAEHAIKDAIAELEANDKFQELKASIKAISEGLKEVKKRQNAVIQYSLSLLDDKGAK